MSGWADLDLISKLIQKGVDVNTLQLDGKRPLSVAVIMKASDLVKNLLENGADVDAPDADGNTALHHVTKELVILLDMTTRRARSATTPADRSRLRSKIGDIDAEVSPSRPPRPP